MQTARAWCNARNARQVAAGVCREVRPTLVNIVFLPVSVNNFLHFFLQIDFLTHLFIHLCFGTFALSRPVPAPFPREKQRSSVLLKIFEMGLRTRTTSWDCQHH